MRHRHRGVASKLMRGEVLPYVILVGVVLWAVTSIVARSIGPPQTSSRSDSVGGHLRGGGSGRKDLIWVHSDSQPFNEKSIASQATHLIIVAGHSVLISGDVENAARDDSVWWLLDYQRGRGLPQAIASHIQAGIRIALEDENSLLVFSGGQTRAQTGPETEGGSYFRVADALDLWGGRDILLDNGGEEAINGPDKSGGRGSDSNGNTVRARTTTEEYATDSFENLLFSICRFHEITGSYPTEISFVSFSFKRQRFETLHAGALQWPLDHFHYVGVDPLASTGFNLQESSEGEKKNSLLPFQSDPYGCHSEKLQQKRKERNPFARKAPYELTCPEMKDLLHWCGPQLISKTQVPWEKL
ncbi:hypothetical protein ACHAXR_012638 [Thalassiosira sp. AJA248-18]